MALRLALAQINTTVGDLRGNAEHIRRTLNAAKESHVDLVVFPELCICGYPPEDLLHKPQFLKDNITALKDVAAQTENITTIVGYAEGTDKQCYNAAAVIENGNIASVYKKGKLPNYSVFDEKRYFSPGTEPVIFEKDGFHIAVTICEDIWELQWLDQFLDGHKQKLDLLINLSASPFNLGKFEERKEILAQCSRYFKFAVAYCNLVGGQDELVFDGRSMIFDADGHVAMQAKEFEEDLCLADLKRTESQIEVTPVSPSCPPMDELSEVHRALVLGTYDYVNKNGFSKVVIGLSGGIDSALVAAIAVEALGKENVIGITMPSRFNTAETRSDAEKLADNLDIEFLTVPIADTLDAFSRTLANRDGWDENGLAYENLQARIRGGILMSYSNQFGWLVLTTGNKSETGVGYSTLYGDSCGGFAVIKDVLKTLVYKLCYYINEKAGKEIIPETT
ncbi:MAG: NAD+ synthase, partial [Planctomycetota bacterium]